MGINIVVIAEKLTFYLKKCILSFLKILRFMISKKINLSLGGMSSARDNIPAENKND